MGRSVALPTESQYVTPLQARTIRKRKKISGAAPAAKKSLRFKTTNHDGWHENDDEDSSSNDTTTLPQRNQSSKQANISSILIHTPLSNTGDNALSIESPKPVYTLRPSVVNGTILFDLNRKQWRLGRPIGKGNFGEIFLASNVVNCPVTNDNAKYVVKVEPHSNGPLFVEIHCLLNTAKKDSENFEDKKSIIPDKPPSGIPDYIASGSHYFNNARYRFLVLQRFDRDLHSLIKNCRINEKSLLTLAIQILRILENLHDKGYCHNDIKAQNLMISKCKYVKRRCVNTNTNTTNTKIKSKYDYHYEDKLPSTDSGNSTEQETDENIEYNTKSKTYNNRDDSEYFADETSNSMNSSSMDNFQTPVNRNRKRRGRNNVVEFSGSNPVRSCRRQNQNTIYDEMVTSHYLRPTKRVSYSEFFNEDGLSVMGDKDHLHAVTSDDESEEFVPHTLRRTPKKSLTTTSPIKRLTRRQEKLMAVKSKTNQESYDSRKNNNISETVFNDVVEEEFVFLIDYGLASKFMDNGMHRPFIMDQRRAHDGTLEFTSRDAHMGAHSRRSDLECLGFNLIYWSQGYLPWKEAASQQQQETVHRAKEYLMTNVREMLKQIYGKQVPKYLGEFLHHINQLAYHERPDYARYRRIFQHEYELLGYSVADMRLNSSEIVQSAVRVKDEIENKHDIVDLSKYNALNIMRRLPDGTPLAERTPGNRVSPKNLRSKSDKKSIKKKKFSWAEVLSQDPDQIARERAEKEFDREDEMSEGQQPIMRKYKGNPTYAILEIEERIKARCRTVESDIEEEESDMDQEQDVDEEVNEDEDLDDDEQQNDYETGSNEESCSEEENGEEVVETGTDEESDTTEVSECSTIPTQRTRRYKQARANKIDTAIVQKTTERQTNSRLITRTRRNKEQIMKLSTVTVTESNKNRGTVIRTTRKLTITNGVQAASAAGEIEHHLLKSLDNSRDRGCEMKSKNVVSDRRTRRCINKTEDVEGEMTTNFKNIYKMWGNNYNSENIYFKTYGTAARRTKKPILCTA
ncbi:uncharacterized protein LOC119680131 [Teleopsis dalmanni]|uniref:uncharacterized protein LOC119680131 n=1 Tax=Teleopsis dalmanni TaxID=139649 RepID=UPI0018CFBF27|nr:uncharacterized protein LOC119680131 [Teleopsis dalmanni]XP_037948736.1 uncharacterized protein LOC119680131 [Teleopsis dalmanni]